MHSALATNAVDGVGRGPSVTVDAGGRVDRWRVENTWSGQAADKGYFAMDGGHRFDGHVYERRAQEPSAGRSATVFDGPALSLPAGEPNGLPGL